MGISKIKRIVIRTFGGPRIGYGHFFRCYSLAKALCRSVGSQITFIVNKDLEEKIRNYEFEYVVNPSLDEDLPIVHKFKPGLFIFDSYLGNDRYLQKIKAKTKLMIFDDNNDIYDSTIPDILLNGNIYAKELKYNFNKNSLYLLGPEYLVMREDYWTNDEAINIIKDGLTITTGGSDPYELSYSILESIKYVAYKKRIIIGPGFSGLLIKKIESIQGQNTELIYKPNSIRPYIQESQVVIASCGSTIYEVLKLKAIPIIFSMADNQDNAAQYFKTLGIPYLGKFPDIDLENLPTKVKVVMSQVQSYDHVFSLIKGNSVMNVITKILNRSEDET